MSREELKGLVISWGLRLQHRTWRVRVEGREHMDRLYADGNRFLLCFWHGKYVPIFPLLEGYEACVISSRSERGSVIAETARNFGFQSVLVPDQPRPDTPLIIGELLSAARAGGLAVDGPLGPRHRVKSGVIRTASAFGFDLLPMSVDSRQKIVFKRRWDQMEIPMLFTKVCLVIGEPIQVPPELRRAQVRELTVCLAETILKLDKKATDMVRKERAHEKLLER